MSDILNQKLFKLILTALPFVVLLFIIISTSPDLLNIEPSAVTPAFSPPVETPEIQSRIAIDDVSPEEPPEEIASQTATLNPLLEQFLKTPGSTQEFKPEQTAPTLTTTPTPALTSGPPEWNQDAANPQRTGYIQEEPQLPWELLWTWNGPDERGGVDNHFYDAPQEARTITGGRFIYAPAGELGLFALSKVDGTAAWNFTGASVNVSPAYDPASDKLFVGGDDGKLYKIDAYNGNVIEEYQTGSPINKSILLAEGYVHSITESGHLHKVNMHSMSSAWVFAAGAKASTAPAFSQLSQVIVFATEDLHLHAVNSKDGTSRWRVKPTTNPARFPFTFEGYWPVISEKHGIVFFRLNLGMEGLWSGPLEGQKYPETNHEIRTYLEENPHLKNLFALDLETGEEKFIPAVGYGGVEMLIGEDEPELITGPVPVLKPLPDGGEVAYLFFRNGQSPHHDGRWDSHIGEMVLDEHTIPGMEPGDLRFVRFANSYVHITDEQCPLTMAGSTIFHAHWGASESTRITDRSPELGHSYDNPIRSEENPVVIRRMQACQDYNPESHWTTCGLTLYDDGRFWNGPGWWVYWDNLDPPTPSRRAYSEGILPRYTYVSDGMVIVQGNGGELMIFKHSVKEQ
jgi:outer membrane protein assembly factor BamB